MDIKDLENNKSEFNIEDFKKAFSEIFYKSESKSSSKTPYVKSCGDNCWEICTGKHTFWTNDAGYDMFNKAVEKEFENYGKETI